MASYRYRAAMPANAIGASVNDMSADVLIFAKPMMGDVELAKLAKLHGRTIIVDFCDDHFATDLYRDMLRLADAVTCSTPELASRCPVECRIVPDAYEYPEVAPHCHGTNLLWFGHKTNLHSIKRLGIDCRIVSNAPGTIPWSMETMLHEFALADIVLMPATVDYKSPNRTIEAIRQGCFVVAEPHPAINDFPIYIGDIREGIEWSKHNDANKLTTKAQKYISEKYSPKIQADAWRKVLARFCTLDAAPLNGPAGLALT